MLWQIEIRPKSQFPDRGAAELTAQAAELGLARSLVCATAHGFLVEGPLSRQQIDRVAAELLVDTIVEQSRVLDAATAAASTAPGRIEINVLPKPGVMDPVAQSAEQAICDLLSLDPQASASLLVRTFRRYWLEGVSTDTARSIAQKLLANDAIEQAVIGPLQLERLEIGSKYTFERVHVPIRELSDGELINLSRTGQLYLSLTEMQTIQAHFRELDREPTDAELETIAQTWSEHCSHKTLAGRIAYRDENGERYQPAPPSPRAECPPRHKKKHEQDECRQQPGARPGHDYRQHQGDQSAEPQAVLG